MSGPSGPTNDSSPSFAFTGTDDVTATGQLQYSTRLDQGEWSAYSSDTSVTLAVADGPHTISVRARDEAGNEDPTPAQAVLHRRHGRAHGHRHDPGRRAADPHAHRDLDARRQRPRARQRRHRDAHQQHRPAA